MSWNVHGGNFARGTIYIENLFTESNYSNDYFFKVFSFTSITINNGAFAIPNDFVNSGLPVFDLTSSGSANLTLNNVSGFISPVYSLAGAGSVTSIPNISNQAEYQVYGSPFQLTGNITSGSNSIANVPITSAMYVGSSTSTIASGNTYLILSTGSNFTSFGSANNSVGTVFSATSGGTAIGTAQQLNITVGNSYFLAGYGLQNSVVGAGGFVSGQTYKILNVGSLGYAYTDFTSVGASNNYVGTYFTATGSGSGVGKALLISTITAISGTGGTYLTITISNNANQTVTGGLFSFSRLASSNLLGMSGSLFTKGTATPDLVFPNSYGTSNLPTYAVGSYNTGIYSSGVDGNGSQIINLTNSGNASYQFSKNLLSLTQSSARVNFPSISAVANTPIIQFGGSGGGGIGYPSTGNGNAISLQGNVNGSTQDLLIAGGLSGKPYLAISSANGLSGTFTLVAGTKAVGNVNITANSVVMVTLKTLGGTRAGNPDIVLTAGTGFTATGGSSDTSTYNYIILSASN